MKKAKAPRVPVLENAFEVNLPKLIRAAKATGSSWLVLDDGDLRTVAVLADRRLAVFLGGRDWVVDIVPVQCLQGRVRPLLKCPRAHEGNFQSLYFRTGELACRHCHALRYHSTLASDIVQRARLKRIKLSSELGGKPSDLVPPRRSGRWRKKYYETAAKYVSLSAKHYSALKTMLSKQ